MIMRKVALALSMFLATTASWAQTSLDTPGKVSSTQNSTTQALLTDCLNGSPPCPLVHQDTLFNRDTVITPYTPPGQENSHSLAPASILSRDGFTDDTNGYYRLLAEDDTSVSRLSNSEVALLRFLDEELEVASRHIERAKQEIAKRHGVTFSPSAFGCLRFVSTGVGVSCDDSPGYPDHTYEIKGHFIFVGKPLFLGMTSSWATPVAAANMASTISNATATTLNSNTFNGTTEPTPSTKKKKKLY